MYNSFVSVTSWRLQECHGLVVLSISLCLIIKHFLLCCFMFFLHLWKRVVGQPQALRSTNDNLKGALLCIKSSWTTRASLIYHTGSLIIGEEAVWCWIVSISPALLIKLQSFSVGFWLPSQSPMRDFWPLPGPVTEDGKMCVTNPENCQRWLIYSKKQRNCKSSQN